MGWWQGYLTLWSVVIAICFRELKHILTTMALPIPDVYHALYFITYIVFLAALSVFLPGKIQYGAILRDNTRKKYKCNGLLVAGTVVSVFGTAVYNDKLNATYIADNTFQLFCVANLYSLALAIHLCVHGRCTRRPNWLVRRSLYEDFVMGATLNPTFLGIDLKFFAYRPAMTGWLLINISFALKQSAVMGYLTSRMVLYQIVTAWYIWDYFVHEPKMLYTWDIMAENFGLMLIWGDYVFIPFAFSIQNHYLLHNAAPISIFPELLLTLLCFTAGFFIFRGSNSQKHQFKTDASKYIWGKPPVVIGGKLLASGFWGVARHLNYTGDLLLALSYSIPCGLNLANHPCAYFYFFYLLLLCIHREKRDEQRCAKKYKSTWDEYCLRVPYRMVPFLY